eukprot:6210085-Pleurochrysis_carterae.AAC.1
MKNGERSTMLPWCARKHAHAPLSDMSCWVSMLCYPYLAQLPPASTHLRLYPEETIFYVDRFRGETSMFGFFNINSKWASRLCQIAYFPLPCIAIVPSFSALWPLRCCVHTKLSQTRSHARTHTDTSDPSSCKHPHRPSVLVDGTSRTLDLSALTLSIDARSSSRVGICGALHSRNARRTLVLKGTCKKRACAFV